MSEAQAVLKSASPVFEKKTEDGATFRIYRAGSLEVRTTQEHAGEEVVGMVFAVREKKEDASKGFASSHEKIIKATQFVEKANKDAEETYMPECKYYTVLETMHGSSIVTEMLDDVVTWEENPVDLEGRNSCAKVVRTASCRGVGVKVQDLKNHRAKVLEQKLVGSRVSKSRTYATHAYATAVGGVKAAMKANEKRQREWETNKDSDEDDYELEERVVDKVGAGGAMTLSPCSNCAQPFITGYRSDKGLWFCRECWKRSQ